MGKLGVIPLRRFLGTIDELVTMQDKDLEIDSLKLIDKVEARTVTEYNQLMHLLTKVRAAPPLNCHSPGLAKNVLCSPEASSSCATNLPWSSPRE
jgi:hypothetical protein